MSKEMMQAIEATGTIDVNGHLSLDQPVQAHPGRVRVIVLLAEPSNQTLEEVNHNTTNLQVGQERSPTSDTQPIWERIADISAQVPDEEWEKLPKDLSKNVDHYLYGSPKESE